MEFLVLCLFAIILIVCVILRISIVIALLIGLILFAVYAGLKGFSVVQIGRMSFEGIRTARNILITFLFIGSLTAIWRASGCIPAIVCYASGIISPTIFIMLSFLLCALVSFLTGTSFGTAATVGVICMSIAKSMDLSVFWMGGAILSGSYWGDRCSPVSTSALLVSTITETDLYRNIRNMLRTAIVPTVLVSIIYLIVGFQSSGQEVNVNVISIFEKEFKITYLCLIPAVLIFVLALCKVKVKTAMFFSIVSAVIISVVVQRLPFVIILKTIVMGYQAKEESLSAIINGGGLISMVRVTAIVCIASCYAGIFKETGLLDGLQERCAALADKTNPYFAILMVSIPASMISCNQTLSIMLTQQLSSKLKIDEQTMALYLADSAVVIAALVPWSIAGSVPLATVGATNASMVAALYLYVLPLLQMMYSFMRRSKVYSEG